MLPSIIIIIKIQTKNKRKERCEKEINMKGKERKGTNVINNLYYTI